MISIIGVGNMGAALARAVLDSGLYATSEVKLFERDTARKTPLAAEFHCEVFAELNHLVNTSHTIIICVKPQDRKALFEGLNSLVKPTQLILSIMAGVSLSGLESALGGDLPIVRAMPNLPLQVGCGFTVCVANNRVSDLQKKTVMSIFGAAGECVIVNDEALLDVATAVSGTGPAYLAYLMEALEQAAIELGFEKSLAERAVFATFEGTLRLLLNRQLAPSLLRAQVTSKGGTTEEAVTHMNNEDLSGIFIQAVKKACQRSKQLGS